MNDALVPYRSNLPSASREDSLTRQFYQWETRGRGWFLCNYPVELEPPFRPALFLDDTVENPQDDSRVPTFFSRLFAGTPNKSSQDGKVVKTNAFYRERMAEMDEPVLCDYREEDFKELQIILPKDFKVSLPVAHQLLLGLGHCRYPISFEVIGTSEQTVVQFATPDADFPQLWQQIAAYFPGCTLAESYDRLYNTWQCTGTSEVIVDFGLSNEFMLPLNMVRSFDIDPLIAVTGALADLEEDELGVFQVVFQKTRSDWATEIMDSVRFFDGTPFFSNAPEMIPLAKQKISQPLFAAVIRVAARSYDRERSMRIIRGISSAFTQLANPVGNELIPLSNDGYHEEYHVEALTRRLSFRSGVILNSEELVSLTHPPSAVVRSKKLVRDCESTKAAPSFAIGNGLELGENVHKQNTVRVSLSNEHRTRHIHLIGSSGSGKSTLLLSLIKQDLDANQGLCIIDPHGDLIDAVINNVPDRRVGDVILFDPSDSEFPVGFNILQAKTPLEKTILSSDLVATFRRMATSWGDVMDSVLANAILAFIESTRGGTLFELKRFLVEKDFREEFLESVTDESIRYFWEDEFPLISGKPQSSILIRLDAFLRQSLIRNIVCQKENKLDFRSIMDGRKILLVKLSQGLIGEENAYLLGTMLVSRIYQSALSRQDSHDRPYFWLYLDEFHHFITPSMERILSGTRKYNLGLILAHQEFRQMQARSQEVASSVLSNCYTRICFRLGDNDSEKFAGGFSFFDAKALQNLGVGEAIARVERADFDFNLKVNQVPEVDAGLVEKRTSSVVDTSRNKYAKPRSEVEAEFSLIRNRKKARKEDPAKEIRKDKEQPRDSQTTADAPARTSEKTERRGEHEYLQNLIKRIGEDKGFRATTESEVFGGVGRIDVALENDAHRIAVEIAVTNTTDYELQNIQKCLAARFDRLVVVSTDSRHLNRIQERAKLVLNEFQLSKVSFIEPEHFHLFLDSLQIVPVVEAEPEKIKGYKVKTTFKETSRAESETKKNVILEILSRAWRRNKKKRDE
jgi:hypothetical protein